MVKHLSNGSELGPFLISSCFFGVLLAPLVFLGLLVWHLYLSLLHWSSYTNRMYEQLKMLSDLVSLFQLATNRYVKNVTNLITFIYFNKNGYSMSILWIEMLGNLLVKEGKKHFMSLSLSNSNSYQCGVRKMISAITLHWRMLQYGRSATNDHSIHLFLQVWVYRHCSTSSNIRWSVYSPLSSWRLFTWRKFIWRQMT